MCAIGARESNLFIVSPTVAAGSLLGQCRGNIASFETNLDIFAMLPREANPKMHAEQQ